MIFSIYFIIPKYVCVCVRERERGWVVANEGHEKKNDNNNNNKKLMERKAINYDFLCDPSVCVCVYMCVF